MNAQHTADVLHTERLFIRPFSENDFPAAESLWSRALDRSLSYSTIEWMSRHPYETASLGQAPFGDRAVCLRESGELVGIVGLVAQPGPFCLLDDPEADDGVWTMEVGMYWCTDPPQQGAGIATEAANAMSQLAAKSMRVRRVIAFTQHENKPSQAVMQRLGMKVHHIESATAPWMQVVGVLRLDHHEFSATR